MFKDLDIDDPDIKRVLASGYVSSTFGKHKTNSNQIIYPHIELINIDDLAYDSNIFHWTHTRCLL